MSPTNQPMSQPTAGSATGAGASAPAARAERKVMRGVVTSAKMQKTIVVEVRRKVRHPLYEKYVSRRTRLYAHDDKGEAAVGDVVELAQTRPMSRLKRWRLLRVVQRAPVD